MNPHGFDRGFSPTQSHGKREWKDREYLTNPTRKIRRVVPGNMPPPQHMYGRREGPMYRRPPQMPFPQRPNHHNQYRRNDFSFQQIPIPHGMRHGPVNNSRGFNPGRRVMFSRRGGFPNRQFSPQNSLKRPPLPPQFEINRDMGEESKKRPPNLTLLKTSSLNKSTQRIPTPMPPLGAPLGIVPQNIPSMIKPSSESRKMDPSPPSHPPPPLISSISPSSKKTSISQSVSVSQIDPGKKKESGESTTVSLIPHPPSNPPSSSISSTKSPNKMKESEGNIQKFPKEHQQQQMNEQTSPDRFKPSSFISSTTSSSTGKTVNNNNHVAGTKILPSSSSSSKGKQQQQQQQQQQLSSSFHENTPQIIKKETINNNNDNNNETKKNQIKQQQQQQQQQQRFPNSIASINDSSGNGMMVSKAKSPSSLNNKTIKIEKKKKSDDMVNDKDNDDNRNTPLPELMKEMEEIDKLITSEKERLEKLKGGRKTDPSESTSIGNIPEKANSNGERGSNNKSSSMKEEEGYENDNNKRQKTDIEEEEREMINFFEEGEELDDENEEVLDLDFGIQNQVEEIYLQNRLNAKRHSLKYTRLLSKDSPFMNSHGIYDPEQKGNQGFEDLSLVVKCREEHKKIEPELTKIIQERVDKENSYYQRVASNIKELRKEWSESNEKESKGGKGKAIPLRRQKGIIEKYKIPRMIRRSERSYRFISDNCLIDDPPRSFDIHQGITKAWTALEEDIFYQKFQQYPKNMGKIASFLPNKTTGDVVNHYYLVKYGQRFQDMMRALKKKRKYRKRLYTEGTPIADDLEEKAEKKEASSQRIKWTNVEIRDYLELLRRHGKNFQAISNDLGTKTSNQCRNFFTNHKRKYSLDKILENRKGAKNEPRRRGRKRKKKEKVDDSEHLPEARPTNKEGERTSYSRQSDENEEGEGRSEENHSTAHAGDHHSPKSQESKKEKITKERHQNDEEEEEEEEEEVDEREFFWTRKESNLFLDQFRVHGRDWNELSKNFEKKTSCEVKEHFLDLKFRLKLVNEEKNFKSKAKLKAWDKLLQDIKEIKQKKRRRKKKKVENKDSNDEERDDEENEEENKISGLEALGLAGNFIVKNGFEKVTNAISNVDKNPLNDVDSLPNNYLFELGDAAMIERRAYDVDRRNFIKKEIEKVSTTN